MRAHHPHEAPPGYWTACSDPERPIDGRCFLCRLSAEAYLRARGDLRGKAYRKGEDGEEIILLSEALADAYEGLAAEAAK
jgi:hypothetical protein